jgi:hypothetical protein
MVFVEGLRTVALGLVVGIGGALGAGRLIAALLFEVRPYDPLMMATVAGTLMVAAALACALPVRRAMRVDPMIGFALRVGHGPEAGKCLNGSLHVGLALLIRARFCGLR